MYVGEPAPDKEIFYTASVYDYGHRVVGEPMKVKHYFVLSSYGDRKRNYNLLFLADRPLLPTSSLLTLKVVSKWSHGPRSVSETGRYRTLTLDVNCKGGCPDPRQRVQVVFFNNDTHRYVLDHVVGGSLYINYESVVAGDFGQVLHSAVLTVTGHLSGFNCFVDLEHANMYTTENTGYKLFDFAYPLSFLPDLEYDAEPELDERVVMRYRQPYTSSQPYPTIYPHRDFIGTPVFVELGHHFDVVRQCHFVAPSECECRSAYGVLTVYTSTSLQYVVCRRHQHVSVRQVLPF